MAQVVDDINTELVVHNEQLLTIDLSQGAKMIAALSKSGVLETSGTQLLLTDPEMTYDRYEALGIALGVFNRACSWWIGDWLIFGEGTYGERFAQAASMTGLAEQTLTNRAYVCRNVAPSRRMAGVPFSVHAEVAPLPPKEQTKWLRLAQQNGLTRAEVRARMKATRKDERQEVDDDDETPDFTQLVTCVRRLLRNCEEAGENIICRREDIVQLRAAFGEEPD